MLFYFILIKNKQHKKQGIIGIEGKLQKMSKQDVLDIF
tara:strand:+ start:211 stop:324 length:114 start_codon:yes stop_codon:yes gene_type:complete